MTPQPRLNCKPHSLPQLCASPTLHSIANIVTKTRRKPWERCTPTQPKRNGTFRMCQSIQVALATFSILFTNLYSVLGFLSPQSPHNHRLNSPNLPPPSPHHPPPPASSTPAPHTASKCTSWQPAPAPQTLADCTRSVPSRAARPCFPAPNLAFGDGTRCATCVRSIIKRS